MTSVFNQITDHVLKLVSEEAEQAVIGAVLVTPDMFVSLQGFLRPSDFFILRHRIMWLTFERLMDRGSPVDMTTVVLELQAQGQFKDVGEYMGVMEFMNVTSNSMHAETYGRIVQRLATRRSMLEAADGIYKNATDETINIDTAIARFESVGMTLRRRQMAVDTPQLTIEQAAYKKLEALYDSEERHAKNPRYVIGVRTGLTDLDSMLDGLRPGVTTLAGATGSGKTAMCLQMVQFASQKGILRDIAPRPAKTLFFSGEMTQDQLMNRLLGSMTGIPIRHIERGSYTTAQKQTLVHALENMANDHRLSFESGKRMNTAQIRQRVRTLVIDNELDLLVLDGLLQIESLTIDPSDSSKQKSYMESKRRDVIEGIMNDLEDITLTYETPILLTHQLSRAPSGRADKRPILTDLAEANFVEQKSAVILFLYREAYYEPQSNNPDAAEVICAKNRHGMSGTVHQIYDAQFTRFVDADKHQFVLGE